MGCDMNPDLESQPLLGFNPRTRMGCDSKIYFSTFRTCTCFNPRTRMGCDLYDMTIDISSDSFNPRTRMGCDMLPSGSNPLSFWFQSTHPHGVRPGPWIVERTSPLFQSTHPHGVRPYFTSISILTYTVSIHAPAWGATVW